MHTRLQSHYCDAISFITLSSLLKAYFPGATRHKPNVVDRDKETAIITAWGWPTARLDMKRACAWLTESEDPMEDEYDSMMHSSTETCE